MLYWARLTRSCSRVISTLWLHAPRLPVVHAYCDPHVPVLFSTLLSNPFPIDVLVSNGLGHRSPRTREKIGRFIYSDLVLEPWWTAPGPLTALPL